MKAKDISRKWLLIDAKNQVLGRLASQITKILRGKTKVFYTPFMNCGDNVIVINAKDIKMTGKKLYNHIYYRHTGYPGGIKKTTAYDIINSIYPERLLKFAVKRMMPAKSNLAKKQLKNLYIYSEGEHKHTAQKPQLVKILR